MALLVTGRAAKETSTGPMSITLPGAMKSWLEEQGTSDRDANSSDDVRDRPRLGAMAELQAAIDVGLGRWPAAPLDRSAFKARMRARRGGT